MPSAELNSASEIQAERDAKMRKRGYIIPSDLEFEGFSKAKAKRYAKLANSILRDLKPLPYADKRLIVNVYLQKAEGK